MQTGQVCRDQLRLSSMAESAAPVSPQAKEQGSSTVRAAVQICSFANSFGVQSCSGVSGRGGVASEQRSASSILFSFRSTRGQKPISLAKIDTRNIVDVFQYKTCPKQHRQRQSQTHPYEPLIVTLCPRKTFAIAMAAASLPRSFLNTVLRALARSLPLNPRYTRWISDQSSHDPNRHDTNDGPCSPQTPLLTARFALVTIFSSTREYF